MSKTVAARVDNGTVILLNEQGLECNRFGNQFAVAGVSGEDLITVTKYGIVDHYVIEGGTRAVRSSRGIGGKSHDAVSIQVGSDLNFSIQLANGQTDVYANGQKTRTTGTARVDAPVSSSISSTINTSRSEPEPTYTNVDIPDGFVSGIGHRCKVLVNEPIKGPWSKIILWLVGTVALVVGVIVFKGTTAAGVEPLPCYIVTFGIPAAVFGVGYWLRHAFAKCLVRSHYGLPAVILAIAICSIDPTIGMWALAAAFLLWFWPIWPILLILVCVVGIVAVAIGRAAPQTGGRRDTF
jgi:hypothetical protein